MQKEPSPKADVYGLDGKIARQIPLPAAIFAAKVNPILMAQAVRVYLANQRQGTLSTKTRGEVAGSTKKIYKQKGTGRARHGSKKAPIFIGGGITFGPHPRDFSLSLPLKMRRLALFSALTSKWGEGKIYFVEGWETLEAKTKLFVKAITSLLAATSIEETAKGENKKPKLKKIMLVIPKSLKNVYLGSRNIDKVDLVLANTLNTYQVLNHDLLVFLKDTIGVLEETFLTHKPGVEKTVDKERIEPKPKTMKSVKSKTTKKEKVK